MDTPSTKIPDRDWCNVELTRDKAADLRDYLKVNKISFEPSEAYSLIHFQIYASDQEMKEINEYLSSL